MRTRSLPVIAALLVSAAGALLSWTPPARASSHDATTVALGWQTENADEIVVGSVSQDSGAPASAETQSGRDVEFRVDQSLKGGVAVGASIRVLVDDHGTGAPWRVGLPHLLFLRRLPAQQAGDAGYAPLVGAFSVRAMEARSPESRFPALVASYREALDSQKPETLRSSLVSWMEDGDPGVAWSGATDFVRHTELQADLSEADAARIVAAFRRQAVGKNTKGALALAVAATRSPDAVAVLTESLLLPGAARIRGPVAEALRRIDPTAAEAAVASKLDHATAEQRVALLGALGVVGGVTAAPTVASLLGDDAPSVRIEAAAALGGMARNARARDAEARLGVVDSLSARIAGDSLDTLSENEARAVLWALAQLDEPGAFDVVRGAAAKASRQEIRVWAASLLARPRQSLLLTS